MEIIERMMLNHLFNFYDCGYYMNIEENENVLSIKQYEEGRN